MLIGSFIKFTSALLQAHADKAKPALPPQASPVAQAASGRSPAPDRSATPGVVFDLSDSALQAAASSGGAPGPEALATASAPPPFLPSGLTIAAEIAAVQAPREVPAASRPVASIPAGALPATPAAGPAKTADAAASPIRPAIQADADEEARARALAIQAQERGKLLSLVEQLADAGTEPPVALDGPAGDDGPAGTASPAAA